MIQVALIGYGYWGPNLARNFSENSNFSLKYIVDKSEDQLKLAKSSFPTVNVQTGISSLLNDNDLSLVLIATPPSTHFELVKIFLDAGKHVFVEKPFTLSAKEARQLVSLARELGLSIFVDHTFLFSPYIRYIKKMIDSKELGELRFLVSNRFSLGKIQLDSSVHWDLLVHDLSILKYLIGFNVLNYSGVSSISYPSKFSSTAIVNISYPDDLLIQLSVSWLSAIKVRQFIIVGSQKTVVYDDTNSSEKIKVYDSDIYISGDPKKSQINYRSGQIYVPFIEDIEALRIEVNEIADHLRFGKNFLSSGEFSLDIIDFIEKLSESKEE